jgi:hypothetical protein
MPTVFVGPARRDAQRAADGHVLEPEVLESLEDIGGPGSPGPGGARVHVRPMGCALGPGCGCLGLPLLAIAGVLVSALIALLWVLSLGRVPASLLRLAKQARRGFPRT